MINNTGIVQTNYLKLNKSFELESSKVLSGVEVAYETYGKLNDRGDNAILICHALTGDAHAAGYHRETDRKPGWWDNMIGPSRAFDTNKFFVICSNVLGGCSGTTGPCSINPATGRPFGRDFPVITIEDMVKVQFELINYLGVKKLIAAGGSMGGMQALEWAITYPEYVKSIIVIAMAPRQSAQGIAFNAVGRNAILSDPNYNNGDYYDKKHPEKGLAIARMVGHITYLSEEAMHGKFGRNFKEEKPNFGFGVDFQVESYLDYQGRIFVDRFDANSYLYITKAVDYYDPGQKFGTLENAFNRTNAKFLAISFDSDWLYPTSAMKEVVNALIKKNKEVSFIELQSLCGHDAFLIEHEKLTRVIESFLKNGE